MNFHKLRIRGISSGKIGLTLDGGTERTICASGGGDVSLTLTTAALTPAFILCTDTTAAKSADADFFAFKARGLSR
jgi:hypothetical protein